MKFFTASLALMLTLSVSGFSSTIKHMQPQQPGTFVSPPSSQPGQYDFIVNYGKGSGPNWLTAASMKTRIAVVGGGFLTLLLIAWIFIALLNSSGNTSLQQLVTITQDQTELVRISDSADSSSSLDPTKDFATTVKLSLTSDMQAVLAYLKLYNAVPANDVLAKGKNTKTDASLDAAQAAGDYDSAYLSVASQELSTYMRHLKQAFNNAPDGKERVVLSNAYSHAQMLLALSKQGR